jgi:hypothetical protein
MRQSNMHRPALPAHVHSRKQTAAPARLFSPHSWSLLTLPLPGRPVNPSCLTDVGPATARAFDKQVLDSIKSLHTVDHWYDSSVKFACRFGCWGPVTRGNQFT